MSPTSYLTAPPRNCFVTAGPWPVDMVRILWNHTPPVKSLERISTEKASPEAGLLASLSLLGIGSEVVQMKRVFGNDQFHGRVSIQNCTHQITNSATDLVAQPSSKNS